jgi:hypothetical protein
MRPGEEEITELVNAVVDGEATPEQQAELQELLRSSAETRALFEGTLDVAHRLEAMRVEEPPRELKRSILESLPPPNRQAGTPVLHFSRRRMLFAAGWAAAAAFVLAVVIFERREPSNTGATMAPIVATYRSDEMTLVVRRQHDLYILEPLTPTRPATVTLRWDPEKLVFVGISGGEDADSGKAQVSFTLREPSQRAGVILRPRPGAGAAEVLVSVNETEMMRAVVPLQ